MKRGVCDECSERRGSAAHLEVQQFNTRSNEEVRLQVNEHRKRRQEYSQNTENPVIPNNRHMKAKLSREQREANYVFQSSQHLWECWCHTALSTTIIKTLIREYVWEERCSEGRGGTNSLVLTRG